MSENAMLLSSNHRKSPLSCLANPSENKGVRESLASLQSYCVYTIPIELIRRSRSPLAPLKKRMCLLFGFPDSKAHQAGGTGLLVPLFKGDLGGSTH
jgi:hypothetical protein